MTLQEIKIAIRNQMIREGMDYETVAKKAHISKSTLYRWMEGATIPKITDLLRVMKSIGLDMEIV